MKAWRAMMAVDAHNMPAVSQGQRMCQRSRKIPMHTAENRTKANWNWLVYFLNSSRAKPCARNIKTTAVRGWSTAMKTGDKASSRNPRDVKG